MESISMRQIVFAATARYSEAFARERGKTTNETGIRRRRGHQAERRGFRATHSKISDFQDVQSYVKPFRILPAEEVDITREDAFVSVGESQCLYRVKLETSRTSASGLSDFNARVLLCLIDENGSSMLQAISASSLGKASRLMDTDDDERLRFQRGCIDEFAFMGPKLSRIVALWIGLESGQWRLAGVSLSVVSANRSSPGQNDEENFKYYGSKYYRSSPGENDEENFIYYGSKYDFETDEILLGEKGDLSMVELKPSLVTDLSGAQPSAFLTTDIAEQTGGTSNKESMKEYRDLKFSLLLYDSVLILVGTSVSSFALGETSGASFFIGGVTGFLYLLLLQRSVDGLQVSGSVSEDGRKPGGFKSPIPSISLALGLSAVAAKYGTGESPFALTSKELLLGMLGFLACKVAVVIAAVRPIQIVSGKSQ